MYILISNYNKLVVSTSNVWFPEIDQSNHNIHGIYLSGCFFFSGRSISLRIHNKHRKEATAYKSLVKGALASNGGGNNCNLIANSSVVNTYISKI